MFPTKWQNTNDNQLPEGARTSLQMLLSERLISNDTFRRTRTPTAQLLEDITYRLLDHVAAHDWTNPDFAAILSEDYSAHLDYQEEPFVRGRDTFIDNYRTFTDSNPDYKITPISLLADVHENNSTAAVWMLLKVVGHPPDVQRESVTIIYFRRRAGKWQAYKQNGMRGATGGCF